MYWQLKLIRNAMLGLLPFPEILRKAKRKFVPNPFPSIDEWTLEQGIRHVEKLNSTGYSIRGKVVMEFGTGWHPIIPIIFFLAGCEKILLVDKQKLLDARSFFLTAKNLIPHKNKLSEKLNISPKEVEDKLTIDGGKSLALYLNQFNMEYHAPCNILQSELPHNSIDIVISRAVLEHIKPELLKLLFMYFRLILKTDGKMSHSIDNSDHWEHGDKRISRLNFLKFNEKVFGLISSFNPLDYQNRLRHFEYIEFLRSAGFKIDFEEPQVDKKALLDLKNLRICERYKNVAPEELAILTSYIVASKM